MSSPLVPGWFDVLFTLVPLFIIAIIGFGVFVAVRNYRAAKRGGVDPFAVDTELKVRALDSAALAPAAPSIEERLAELSRLHSSGLITDEELAQARMQALSGR